MLYPITHINNYQLKTNKYFINELGEVFSNYNSKLLKLKPFSDASRGYLKIKLYDINSKPLTLFIHRLVYTTINNLSYGFNGLQINHKDGNKLNNNINNLELVTPKDNVRHSIINKLSKSRSHQLTLEILSTLIKEINYELSLGKNISQISKILGYDSKVIRQVINKTHPLMC